MMEEVNKYQMLGHVGLGCEAGWMSVVIFFSQEPELDGASK